MTDVLFLACCILAAVNGGVFFAFSNFIMRALDRLGPAAAIAAMRSINIVVITPSFMTILFGTGVVAALAAALAVLGDGPFGFALAGALTYVLGCVGVTMFGNVPLNNAIGAAGPIEWDDFYGPWTRYNHIRTAACLLSAALFGAAALHLG